MMLYDRLMEVMEKEIPPPDITIYLQAKTELIVERIKRRGRPFEKNLERDYLEVLQDAYNYFFSHYTDSPLIVVNTAEVDFLGNESDLGDLIDQMEKLKSGIATFAPRQRG
jgi:deoxyguanosine kinase